MQTLTITAARKNLGRLLQAAAQGKDIGIISGADIIALRKVDVESTDYAQRQYGVSSGRVETFSRAAGRRYRKLNRAGKLSLTTAQELEKMLEKATRP
jgi:antitoxin (DNA-binding transcriptional repressor) of toxin-antitoxin stability system